MEPTRVRLTIPDTVDPTALMGPADSHLRRIEGAFEDAMVVVRGNQVLIVGPAEQVEQATSVFSQLIKTVEGGEIPTSDEVDILVGQVTHGARRGREGAGSVILSQARERPTLPWRWRWPPSSGTR